MRTLGPSSLALSAVVFASLWAACALPDYQPPPSSTGGQGAGGQGQGGTGGQGVGGVGEGGAGQGGMGGQGGVGQGGMGGQGGAVGCMLGDTQACYPGQTGTNGVGKCAAGTQACLGGGQWDPKCDGAVVPTLESCEAPDGDVNCDGHAGCDGVPLQGKAIGGGQDEIVYSMAINRAASAGVEAQSYAVGVRDTTLPPGGFPTVGNVLFIKRGPAGAINSDWSDKFAFDPGVPAYAYGTGVSVLPTEAEEIAVAGSHFANLTINAPSATTLTNDTTKNGFVALFKQNGDLLWARSFGGPSNGVAGIVEVRSVASDSAGNVYAAGTFGGQVDFGNGPVLANDGSDGFVVSFDKAGAYRWHAILGGAGEQAVLSVAVSPKDELFIAGNYPVEAALYGNNGQVLKFTSSGGTDVIAAQLDPQTGLSQWIFGIGGAGDAGVRGIAANTDKVVLTGGFRGVMSTSLGTYTSGDPAPMWDAYVVALDHNGAELATFTSIAAGNQIGNSVVFDPLGDVLVTGIYSGSFPVLNGNAPQTQMGDLANVFVMKLPGALEIPWGPYWARGYGDMQSQIGMAVLATPTMGHVLVGGGFQGTLTGTSGVLTSAGGFDAFIAELTN